MFKIFVGIGILASPHAFSDSGIVMGCLTLSVIAILNVYTIMIMRDCKMQFKNQVNSYSELGYAVYGKTGKAFVDFCILSS
jgi:amino acid permease